MQKKEKEFISNLYTKCSLINHLLNMSMNVVFLSQLANFNEKTNINKPISISQT